MRFTVRKKILKSYGNICYYILNRNFSQWLTICILDSHFGMTVCTITNLINDNNSNNIQLMIGIILSLKTRSDCAVSELENLPDELKDSMPNCHLQITSGDDRCSLRHPAALPSRIRHLDNHVDCR